MKRLHHDTPPDELLQIMKENLDLQDSQLAEMLSKVPLRSLRGRLGDVQSISMQRIHNMRHGEKPINAINHLAIEALARKEGIMPDD